MRHASETRLREETGDLVLVTNHLRHNSLYTAQGYAKAITGSSEGPSASGERPSTPSALTARPDHSPRVRASIPRSKPPPGSAEAEQFRTFQTGEAVQVRPDSDGSTRVVVPPRYAVYKL